MPNWAYSHKVFDPFRVYITLKSIRLYEWVFIKKYYKLFILIILL